MANNFKSPIDSTMKEPPKMHDEEEEDFFFTMLLYWFSLLKKYKKYDELLSKRHAHNCASRSNSNWKYQLVHSSLERMNHIWDYDQRRVIKFSMESIETGPPVVLNTAEEGKTCDPCCHL